MANRTTQTIVHFMNAFLLPGFSEPLAAGDYRVDHDEESLEGRSLVAWHRVRSFIHLPPIGVQSAMHQMVPVKSSDIDAASAKDKKNA